MTTSATVNELTDVFFEVCNDASLAQRLTHAFCTAFGGDMFYLPKAALKNSTRNAEIRALFDGLNYRELAQAYDLTPRQIRVIVDGK